MIRTIIILITLLLAINVSAQTFKNEGFRFLTEESVSESKLQQILNYNFKDYRKQEYSTIIKIIDGPTIELFSFSEMKTGIKPTSKGGIKTKIEVSHQESDSGEHIAKYQELEITKVTTINIFNSTTDAVK
jgi:hypothetical protein